MVYVVSDIHGEYDLFIKLLRKIRFSANDKMLICGDIIDKGQDSVKLLKFIQSMPNFYPIIGNHEHEFLKYYWSLMQDSPNDFNDVLRKLRDYFSKDGQLLDWETVDWLESLPYYIEGDGYVCVHAGVPMDNQGRCIALSSASVEHLVYDRNFKEPNVVPLTDKCVFFGHTPTSFIANKPKIIAYKRAKSDTNSILDYYKIHLDLGVFLHGVLGCFCIDTCQEQYVDKWD